MDRIKLTAVITLLIFIALGFNLYESSVFSVVNVKINIESKEGLNFPEDREKIEKVLAEVFGKSLWEVSLSELHEQLQGYLWLEEIELKKDWPNEIYVSIKHKEPSALIVTGEGRLEMFFQDATSIPSSDVYPLPDLPVLHHGKKRSRDLNFDIQNLMIRANDLLKELPSTGPLSAAMISDFYLDEKLGWVIKLAASDHQIFLGEEQLAIRAERVNRVLMYLQSQGIIDRVIDANLAKKVLVRPRKDL